MPTFSVYILFSQAIDRFYVGMTGDSMEERLRRHLSNHSGFTGKAKDWKVMWVREFATKQEALLEERRLKNLKRRAAIMHLINAQQ